MKDRIMEELFPPHYPEDRGSIEVEAAEIQLFTIDELQQALTTMRNKISPVTDEIPAEIMKVVLLIAYRSIAEHV